MTLQCVQKQCWLSAYEWSVDIFGFFRSCFLCAKFVRVLRVGRYSFVSPFDSHGSVFVYSGVGYFVGVLFVCFYVG